MSKVYDTEEKIIAQLGVDFPSLNSDNQKTIAHYMITYPKKWEDLTFVAAVNKVMPEAFSYTKQPSSVLFGILLSLGVVIIITIVYWIVSSITNKDKVLLPDPDQVNAIYI